MRGCAFGGRECVMRSLSDTLKRLSALAAERAAAPKPVAAGRLKSLAAFGANPGALAAKTYIPDDLARGAPLVVVLHGCTQNAEGYDRGSGWSQLADRYGFALLFPEQKRANNPNLCFNWFLPGDSRRDRGEALSIRQMIATVVNEHGLDPSRIYVTGLSAGGAMASVLLASYPELFAGGAIIAGLPYGTASTIPEAFDRMRGHNLPGEVELSRLVRAASSHGGPWPTISIWHGSADATVDPANAAAIASQWRAVHGVATQPSRVETVDTYPRRVWSDAAGRDVIEEYSITGMGHGTPLGTDGEQGCGEAGAYMLEAQISSTHHIARFWGLDGKTKGRAAMASAPAEPLAANGRRSAARLPTLEGRRAQPIGRTPGATPVNQIGKVIEDALRAAGLMR
ncbi:MAG TPA: PHB depolymerase family esterase [Sphingomonas sp.]|nr:PHB depolymerase family esterase [Sphingomonas sp.]